MLKTRLFSVGALCCALSGYTANETAPAYDVPIGIWTWQADMASPQVGLSIVEKEGEWSASVNGFPYPVQTDDQHITLALPDGREFSGFLSAAASRLDGYWLQPPSQLGYQEMTTPLSLDRITEDDWSAVFVEQPRPYRVFLEIFQEDDGEQFAVIRNPERNEIQNATRFRIEQGLAGKWALVAGDGEREVRRKLEQVNEGELQLEYDRFDEPLVLRPAAVSDVEGYLSRRSGDGDVTYQQPVKLDDGWDTAAPEDVGFNRAKLDALIVELASSDPRNRRPRMVHSLLVARKGKLVLEEYFHGYDRESTHDVRSLGKVFASVLVGALQQKGISIDAQDRPIPRIFAAAKQTLDNPLKADITLEHLLTHTSGLDCGGNDQSPGSEANLWDNGGASGFWSYTAALPLIHKPGERYAYCSAGINLVGAALRDASGESVLSLIQTLLAEPLGFSDYHWNLMPGGDAYLGGGAYLRPRDILKLGVVYASDGMWQGERIVPEAWVKKSTSPHIEISPATSGLSPEEFANNYFGGEQAYYWRVDDIVSGDRRFSSYEATGNGGQVLIVVPKLELAVVMTGGNYRMGGIWGRWRDEIVGRHVIAAIEN